MAKKRRSGSGSDKGNDQGPSDPSELDSNRVDAGEGDDASQELNLTPDEPKASTIERSADALARSKDDLSSRYGPDSVESEVPEGSLLDESTDNANTVIEDAESAAAEIVEDVSPDTPEVNEDAVVPVVAPVKVKSGRGLAFMSLLLALASLGGAGYLYYELIHLKPFAKVTDQIAQMDQALTVVRGGTEQSDGRFEALRAELGKLENKQSDAMTALVSEQQDRLASTEQGLIESLNKVANKAPPSQQEWKFAEVEYLLRIANHRVLMEKDSESALQLLSTADAILTELDDFGMHSVRAQLADEILSLKKARPEDLQGLFLRLESLKRQLNELPLKIPEFEAAVVAESATEERTIMTQLGDAVGKFVQFRRAETQVKPLLSPDETMYLELNLRLMLERAQLAALRQHQVVYEESLATARDWLQDYLDPESAEVTALVDEIDDLMGFQLSMDLPDISGSLRTLLETERSAS